MVVLFVFNIGDKVRVKDDVIAKNVDNINVLVGRFKSNDFVIQSVTERGQYNISIICIHDVDGDELHVKEDEIEFLEMDFTVDI